MADPAGRVRLPLNVSESRQTADRPLRLGHRRRRGVHHVAFAHPRRGRLRGGGGAGARADDPAQLLRGRRRPLRPEDEELAALERGHLLYDRDGQGGDFLHAYTVPFEDRFFFEVVERRGGYDGYGAANAAVRMAAQARARPWMPGA